MEDNLEKIKKMKQDFEYHVDNLKSVMLDLPHDDETRDEIDCVISEYETWFEPEIEKAIEALEALKDLKAILERI